MTTRRDPDRLVLAFLDEGPAELSARVIAGIRDDIGRTEQRTARRPWRDLDVARALLLAAPLVAVLVVAGVALFAPGDDAPAGPVATPGPDGGPVVTLAPTQDPGVVPSASPTATPFGLVDGEPWIIFSRDELADSIIAMVRADGTDLHRIGEGRGLRQYAPAWSPDGRRIVFEGNEANRSALWVIDADGTNAEVISANDDSCAPICPMTTSPAWSPDGSAIAFIEHTMDVLRIVASSLRIVDLSSGQVRTVYTTTDEVLGHPSWSPDGRQIALDLERFQGIVAASDTSGRAIGVVDLDAADTAPRILTDWSMFATYPDWHPTQDLILFSVDVRATPDPMGTPVFQTIRSDGSGLAALMSFPIGSNAGQASWTRDGGQIVFTLEADGGRLRVASANADGSNQSWTVGETRVFGAAPRWRPVP